MGLLFTFTQIIGKLNAKWVAMRNDLTWREYAYEWILIVAFLIHLHIFEILILKTNFKFMYVWKLNYKLVLINPDWLKCLRKSYTIVVNSSLYFTKCNIVCKSITSKWIQPEKINKLINASLYAPWKLVGNIILYCNFIHIWFSINFEIKKKHNLFLIVQLNDMIITKVIVSSLRKNRSNFRKRRKQVSVLKSIKLLCSLCLFTHHRFKIKITTHSLRLIDRTEKYWLNKIRPDPSFTRFPHFTETDNHLTATSTAWRISRNKKERRRKPLPSVGRKLVN